MGAGNLISNGGFETGLPGTWTVDPKAAAWGSAVGTAASWSAGQKVLRLAPNQNNSAAAMVAFPFGVGQGVPAEVLAGKSLYVSALLRADGEAKAIVRLYAFHRDGTVRLAEMQQAASDAPVLHRDVFPVPADRSIVALVIFCLVEGHSGAAWFDEVTLEGEVPGIWKEATGAPDPGTALSASIEVDASRKLREIPSSVYGSNLEWAGGGQGIWESAAGRLNPTVVELTQFAGATLMRFPGGVFSDYYRWRQGIGPQNGRPVVDVLPAGPKSLHHFGTDEALAFARTTGGRLLITVNIITATPAEAADWVRYVNKPALEVEHWEVGNEPYVPGPASLSPEAYAYRFLDFARAMRAADPRIKIGAVSDENFSLSAPRQYSDWTARLVSVAGGEIDFLSVHCGYAPAIHKDFGWSSRTVYAALLAAPQAIARHLDDLGKRLDKLAPGRNIKIAVTEWGPYFQTATDGRFVDHPKTLASAVFAASMMKCLIESTRTEIANFFKLVDNAYQGWIGMRRGVYTPKAPLYALTMFRQTFGTVLVGSATSSPRFDAPAVGWAGAEAQVPWLETVSSLSADSSKLYVMVINKHFDRPIRANLTLRGFAPQSEGGTYTLASWGADSNTGTDLPFPSYLTWAAQAAIAPFNRIDRGGPGELGIRSAPLAGASSNFVYEFPACSVTSIVLTRR